MKKYLQNEFIRSVMVLMTGTVLAQVISYLISPILTRIYTTEEMGDLGIYMRAVSFISALATARYEISLPLPKSDSHSYLLYRLSLRIALYTLAGSTLVSLIYLASKSFDVNELFFVVVTLVSAFFLVFINLGTNWAIRKKQFRKISNSRISNSIVSNSLRWLFGVWHWGSWGLLLGTLIGYVVSSYSFVREYLSVNQTHRVSRSSKKTFVLVSEYRQFPLVNLPHVLVDLGRDLLVATLIISFFSKDIFGSFSHSYAMLKLPLTVVGTALSQVLFNKCTEMVHQGKSIHGILMRTVGLLFVLTTPAFFVIYFFGEPLFLFVFGANWGQAGLFSEIMAFWIMTMFIASTISTIPVLLNRQKEFFVMGIITSIIQLVCFGVLPLVIGTGEDDFTQILYAASIGQGIFMLVVVWFTLHYAKKGPKNG